MALERTRFKCNGKPVFKTAIGSLVYTDKQGFKLEQFGMAPLPELAEKEDVLDETGWNIRYIKPGTVAYRSCIQTN